MKQIFIFLSFLLFFLSAQSGFASHADLFEYNSKEIDEAFVELEKLEAFVEQNQEMSQSFLLKNQSIAPDGCQKAFSGNSALGSDLPPFLLGCCLGPIGVVMIIAMADSDVELVLKSIFGCGIPTALFSLGIYFQDPILIEAAVEIFYIFIDL